MHRRRIVGDPTTFGRAQLCDVEGCSRSCTAVAEIVKRAPKMGKEQIIVVNLSGRGDKDLNTVINELDM